MSNFTVNKESLNIKLDIDELSPAQVRLIRSLSTMISHTLTTDEEADFFESASELLKMCAILIKQSNFIQNLPTTKAKEYSEQAIEYSVENIFENMDEKKLLNLDN